MSFFTKLFRPAQKTFAPLTPGIYHYQAPADDPRNYRLHLRLEPDGSGILIVNAATVLHLNQTAAEYAYYLVHSLTPEAAARQVTRRYSIDANRARRDYMDLAERIQELIETPDLDPVTFLDFERQTPFTGQISAPYRLDCAITYRLPDRDASEAAPTERVKEELSLSEWQLIFDKAWSAGIPHVIFTGGEPTLRDDLPELISYAEQKNMVSGLLTDGLRLVNPSYLQSLLQTGLDHLMIILQPGNELSWQAIQNAMAEDIFLAVHLTITHAQASQSATYLDRLAELGVPALSLSAGAVDLADILVATRDQAARLGLDLVWNLPTPYSALNPVALETSGLVEIPEGAGRAWLYVEPDGDVLPSQGLNKVLGNLLRDPWETIWSKTR